MAATAAAEDARAMARKDAETNGEVTVEEAAGMSPFSTMGDDDRDDGQEDDGDE